ncbi:hypothetical protein [Lacinutrix sp. MEBiC02404]
MTKNNLLIIGTIMFLLIFNLSCSSDNTDNDIVEPTDDFNIESYHIAYVQFDTSIYSPDFPNYPDFSVKLEYDEQSRMIKRIGEVSQVPSGAGILNILTDSIYFDFQYAANKVHLVKKSTTGSNITIPENETTLVLDNANKIIQKIIFEEKNNQHLSNYDTIYYSYDNNKLISYIKASTHIYQSSNISVRDIEESELYYSNNNLDSIITISSTKYSDIPNTVYEEKETKRFGGYDSALNPFRKLQLFDETFYRSLSENNFTEYEETFDYYHYPNSDYSQTPILVPSININTRTWGFAYDENGEWIYDQY